MPPEGKKWVYVWPRPPVNPEDVPVADCMRLVDARKRHAATDVLLVGFSSWPEPPGPGTKWVLVSDRVVKLVGTWLRRPVWQCSTGSVTLPDG